MPSCRVRVWGVRGSLPAPGASTVRYGGNTSCITMEVAGEPLLVIDGGTGIARITPANGTNFNVLLSHLHWDHMMGLPFFRAADRDGTHVGVYGPAGETGLRAAFDAVLRPPGFPVTIDDLAGRWDFHDMGDETIDLGAIRVTARHLRHRGPTLGFRVEVGGHVLAYLSDHGPGAEGRGPEQDHVIPEAVLELVHGADVLFHDAQHTDEEYGRLRHFGHSTAAFAVKVAIAGGVDSLLLFHHDPARTDQALDDLVDETRRFASDHGFEGFVRATAEGDSFVLGEKPEKSAATPDVAGAADADHDWRRLGLHEGERRSVTVLFADVSGFTSMAEKMDPEECNLVMRDTMSAMAAVIAHNEGYIEKFIGDAICALFGAPVAHEDEPERAARSALEMHRVLSERARQRPNLPELTMHIGINTGTVIAGTVGDGTQFGVMGDTINTAARLMDKATSHQTFVSAAAARRLRRSFLLEDAGFFDMKGKQGQVQAFNIVRELTRPEVAERTMLVAPLAGRDEELAALTAPAIRAIEDGGGGAVLVVGDAGIGKSRLLGELESVMHGRMKVLNASGEAARGRPCGLMAEALDELVPAGLGSAPGSPDTDEIERLLVRAIVDEAGKRPLLVLLDGLESADDASVELLRFLATHTADAPVVWVGAFRPSLLARLGDINTFGPSATLLRLRPLTLQDTAQLFGDLLPGALDRSQTERLAERAGGVPEFAEEIALCLVDSQSVVEAEGGWHLVGDLSDTKIPDTVQELIEARIGSLPTSSKILLQDASVIGIRFDHTLLERVATMPATLDADLALLADAELLRPPTADDPSGSWCFRSPMVREVAYESILRRQRPRHHQRVATALVEAGAGEEDELAEVLREHFEAAGRHGWHFDLDKEAERSGR